MYRIRSNCSFRGGGLNLKEGQKWLNERVVVWIHSRSRFRWKIDSKIDSCGKVRTPDKEIERVISIFLEFSFSWMFRHGVFNKLNVGSLSPKIILLNSWRNKNHYLWGKRRENPTYWKRKDATFRVVITHHLSLYAVKDYVCFLWKLVRSADKTENQFTRSVSLTKRLKHLTGLPFSAASYRGSNSVCR